MPRNPAPVVHEGMTPEAQETMASATPAEQKFALEIAKGTNATEAFRRVWPAEARNYTIESLWAVSSKLKASDKVRLWIRDFRLGGLSLSREGKVNHAQHIMRLSELSHEAQETGNYGAAVGAEVHIGKASGLYEEQHRPDPDAAEAAQGLQKILGEDLTQHLLAKQAESIAAEDE